MVSFMQCKSLDIPDVKILQPVRHEDSRGFFSEIFNARDLAETGIELNIVQENFALSKQAYTVRGIHFQTPPYEQTKLIQVVSGAIYDVAVDLRKGSPWYGQYVGAKISAEEWNQILVPAGFGHGLCTLEPNTAVIYKVTQHFSKQHDAGIFWNDPELDIPWPIDDAKPVLSAKDAALPMLANFATPFVYEEHT
jgi:dTDP-4-dehydrorhamnose 3,5-epimerase